MSLNDYTINDLYLKISSWFVGHKYFFRKWWVIVILAFDLLMIVYIIVNGLIFGFEIPKYDEMVQGMSANYINQTYRLNNQPQDLVIQTKKAINIGSGRYDLVAKVENPNEDWGASGLSYKFTIGDEETSLSDSYILPGEYKYLIWQNFNNTQGSDMNDIELEVSDLEWQKLTDRTVLEDLNFAVENEKLTSSSSGSSSATVLTADIINRSLYNFWKVDVPVVLLSSGEPIAVSSYTLRTFTSYQSEEITISWLKSLPLSSEIEIKPSVNIFQASNFMSR